MAICGPRWADGGCLNPKPSSSNNIICMEKQVFLPPSKIGVMGGGQLGRMFGFAAAKLGYSIRVFAMEDAAPVRAVTNEVVLGDYNDIDDVREFAGSVEVVTFEFENIPIKAIETAEKVVPVRPSGRVLHIAQNRLREKTFLAENDFPIAPFRPVSCLEDLDEAVRQLGLPGVLKTADFGYDGKGQVKISSTQQLDKTWHGFEGVRGVYEAFIDFEKEISVVAARTTDREFRAFPVFENSHVNHILDVTFAPAAISQRMAKDATQLAARILEKLEVVGVLTVELFVTKDRRLLVNELAPRTHNSGHLTIDACTTSQFEQQLRAVCGLPLGATDMNSPAAMVNLLGDLWAGGEPNWIAVASMGDVKIHNYQKSAARKGRKMGHLTVQAKTAKEAVRRVLEARRRLTEP
jgi:5-(carboxyamino)imidazole ribonucleotide synthase